MPIFLLVAVISVFGTTILGAIAIGHIKRSSGKIIGLPLAVADAIFFPLLLVFAGIALPGSLLLHALLPLQMIAVAIPSSILALIVCLCIGCAVWCKVIPDSYLMAIPLREKLRLAGIGLLIAGIMDAFSGLLWIGQSASVLVELLKQGAPFGWQLALTCLSLGSLMVVYYIIGVALHLMTLEDDGDFTFCLLTAAIVPPGCLIGLPIAIYALVQLSKPEVNALFPAKPPESATTRPVTIVETPPPKWEAALQTCWLAQSNVTRQVLWIALNCLCAFSLFAFFSVKGTSDTDGNHLYQIGFLDPWFVFERRIGPGLRSTSGIFLAWSWLFGVGAYASGWLLFKLKRELSSCHPT